MIPSSQSFSGSNFLWNLFLVIVQCDDPDVDFEQICGFGATGCLGDAIVHTCQCNTDLLVKLSADSSSCVPGKCTINLEKSKPLPPGLRTSI